MISSEIDRYKKNRVYYLNRLKQLIKHIDFIDKSVLDLGCGESLLCTLDEFSKIKSYQGVDYLAYSNTPKYIKSDVIDYLKNDTNSFDLILCLGVLDHMQPNQVQNLISNLH
ncbi:MAG: class I SAM-dependent methyltransferase [Saprospiraceae bacterium]|nr:class I SAM-dependent methyltransferase [Saprospiraceae bacterium]